MTLACRDITIDPGLIAIALVVILILLLGVFAAGAQWGMKGEEP